jgi:hypothetical protein
MNLDPPENWSSYIDYQELEKIKTALKQEPKEWHPETIFRALELTSPENLKAVLLGIILRTVCPLWKSVRLKFLS